MAAIHITACSTLKVPNKLVAILVPEGIGMKKTNIIFKANGKVPRGMVEFISADITLQQAAKLMRDKQCSVLRVGKQGKIENIISAYDIVAYAVAANKGAAKTKVRDIIGSSGG
jgi:CBS domain-containing protein